MVVTKLVSALLVAACAAPVAAQELDASQPVPSFRASADVVTIQASVKDRRGRVLSGLKPADFEIRDNGELRQIVSLRADRDSPLSLAVLVDMSGSMRSEAKIALTRLAYAAIMSQLRPGQDEAAVYIFDSEPRVRQAFTNDLNLLRTALDDFDAFGMTSLYDATAATARELSQRTGTHKAIVLLTDGLDTSSKLTASEASAFASSIDVPVFIDCVANSMTSVRSSRCSNSSHAACVPLNPPGGNP